METNGYQIGSESNDEFESFHEKQTIQLEYIPSGVFHNEYALSYHLHLLEI